MRPVPGGKQEAGNAIPSLRDFGDFPGESRASLLEMYLDCKSNFGRSTSCIAAIAEIAVIGKSDMKKCRKQCGGDFRNGRFDLRSSDVPIPRFPDFFF